MIKLLVVWDYTTQIYLSNRSLFHWAFQGNMNEGIFIHKVHPKGQADQSGNIKQGDRIKSLTIVFEGMVCEDAITLLSYASPYKVKLELERKLQDEPTNEDSVNSESLLYYYLPTYHFKHHVHILSYNPSNNKIIFSFSSYPSTLP